MSPQDSTLVSLSAVTWDFALVGRTRMLTEAWLAGAAETLFVQTPSLRTTLQRTLTALRMAPRPPRHVVRPLPALPARAWTVVPRGVLRAQIRAAARRLRRQLDRRALDWSAATAIVVSPAWAWWLDELPFARAIYDCIDDVAVHTPRPALAELFRTWETELLDRCAGVVVTAERLRERVRGTHPDVSVRIIRNGVNVSWFQERAEGATRPPDLPDRGRPLIGFVGALYEWIDGPLVASVTARLPGYDFVFVGPRDRHSPIGRIAPRENAHFLGPRPYDDVPAYVNAFDVCWVPFDRSRVSQAANPVKIYEYLALGKPVVSTPVADLDSFEGLVRTGRRVEEIVEHLRSAVGQVGADAETRVAFARQNDWQARARDYAAFANALLR